MHIRKKFVLIILVIILSWNYCYSKALGFKGKKIFETQNLVIKQISENAFVHISYKQTNEFGNVSCNGLIVRDQNEVIIFDTPTNDESAKELIRWITEILHCKINAVIPTHFHDDCLGGLKIFHENNIPSYANSKTIELAKVNNFVIPKNSFNDSLILKVGDKTILAKFFGEGHTLDNTVGYFPSEDIMFGGCLIKALKANKGYLGDANLATWSTTVEKVKAEFPNVKIVIPGHGDYGTSKLLDYTINLFK